MKANSHKSHLSSFIPNTFVFAIYQPILWLVMLCPLFTWATPPQTPTQLVITTQPVLGTNGGLLSVQPVVEIRDASNQLVSSSNAEVIAEISNGLGGTLGGTKKVTAVNGVATFTDLTFTGAKGINYTITFKSGPLLAYEPFDYANGTGYASMNGGIGWKGSWQSVHPNFSDFTISNAGFTYTDYSTAGNRATVPGGGSADAGRFLGSATNAYNNEVWLSMLADYNVQGGGFSNIRFINTATSSVTGGVGGNDSYANWTILNNNLNNTVFTTTPLNGTTRLVLLKIDYSNSTSSLWMDPTVVGFDGTQTPSLTVNFAPVFDKIELFNRNAGRSTDEITIASTYQAALHLTGNLTAASSTTLSYPAYAGGTGTSLDPYQITEWEHLYNVSINLNAYFKLMNDLDENTAGYATYASATANSNAGWIPLGNSSQPFSGVFDGDGHIIKGLRINRASQSDMGLFGVVQGSSASIQQVYLQNAQVVAQGNAGTLIGRLYASATHCGATGSVQGNFLVGGLIGKLESGASVSYSYAHATANSSVNAGGLVGDNFGTISNCYATGNVTCSQYTAGGLVGYNMYGVIQNSFSTGSATALGDIGGLVGTNSGQDYDFFLDMPIYIDGVVTNSYWDTQSSGNATSPAGTGKTTSEMKDAATFSSWNFTVGTGIWSIKTAAGSGYISYPYLQNNYYDAPQASPARIPIPGLTVVPFIWQGNVSNDAGSGSNWSNGTVPPNGATIQLSATAQNDLVLSADLSLFSLDFNGSGRKVVLGNQQLTVRNISNANATNYIQTNGTGKLLVPIANAGSVTLPVGNSAYNPVTITNNSGATDDFTVRVIDAVYKNASSGDIVVEDHISRTWDIGKTNANGGSGIDFTFYWNEAEEDGTYINLYLYHHDGTQWTRQTGTTSFNLTNNTLSYTGYTGSFSPFAIVEGSTILPSTGLQLVASCNNKNTLLQWSTLTESNTSHFDVQRSISNSNWITIGTVKASGNSNVQQRYSYTDQQNAAVAQYRLLLVDKDGKTSISNTVSVNCAIAPALLSIPNPVGNSIRFSALPAGKMYQANVFANNGQLLFKGNITNGTVISTAAWLPGVYQLQLSDANGTLLQQKILKQ